MDPAIRCAISRFAPVTQGSDTWSGRCSMPWHRHDRAYAALILSGSYEESGSFGRYRVRPGQVLLHRRFDAHLDRFGSGGAQILNLLLDEEPAFGLGCVADADAIARLTENDAVAAAAALREQLRPVPPPIADWPDLLARDLREDPQLSLEDWARRHRLAPETLSRGFRKVFATPPAGFRAEARTHGALALIAKGSTALAAVAAATGFADQAHMTRAITALTGRPPGHWRKVKLLQDLASGARL